MNKKGPEWEAVTIINPRVNSNSNSKLKCLFCDYTFTGGATRLRAHLLQRTGLGVKICSGDIPQLLLSRVIEEDQRLIDEAKAKTKAIKLALIKNQRTLDQCSQNNLKANLDSQISKFMFTESVPFLKIESPYLKNFISLSCPAYHLPNRKTLATTHLDREYSSVKAAVENAKNTNRFRS